MQEEEHLEVEGEHMGSGEDDNDAGREESTEGEEDVRSDGDEESEGDTDGELGNEEVAAGESGDGGDSSANEEEDGYEESEDGAELNENDDEGPPNHDNEPLYEGARITFREAKASFMRITQFNGAFSCFSCMSQGGRYDLGNASVQVFPYSRNFELRNNDDIPNYAEQALIARQVDNEASVYGIRGAMKSLMCLWFDTQYSRYEYIISGLVHVVDLRIKSIKPPSSFNRLLKSIKKEFSNFD
ncbi:Halomucin [Frankliniella fusca]|uniref:Halomucin n=1 Tax=Frankliniella fusca TaxID=407009 RepID=A0AAE1HFZ9_9NEOP|nr:Halomucin [Frankliniella fusca]